MFNHSGSSFWPTIHSIHDEEWKPRVLHHANSTMTPWPMAFWSPTLESLGGPELVALGEPGPTSRPEAPRTDLTLWCSHSWKPSPFLLACWIASYVRSLEASSRWVNQLSYCTQNPTWSFVEKECRQSLGDTLGGQASDDRKCHPATCITNNRQLLTLLSDKRTDSVNHFFGKNPTIQL